jgi:hypothetical protein
MGINLNFKVKFKKKKRIFIGNFLQKIQQNMTYKSLGNCYPVSSN